MTSSPLLWLGCIALSMFPPLFGVLIGVLVSPSHSSLLLLLCVVSWTIQLCGWSWSAAHHSERYYDLLGSLTFITLVLLSLFHIGLAHHFYPSFLVSLFPSLVSSSSSSSSFSLSVLWSALNLRQSINSLLVLVWAARLGSHLFARIDKDKKDKRFDPMRDSGAKLLLPWMTQGLWAFLVSLPVTLTNTLLYVHRTQPVVNRVLGGGQVYRSEAVDELTWRDVLGWSIWLVGFTLEVLADQQKKRFASKPKNRHQFIDEGLWHYRSTLTLHPPTPAHRLLDIRYCSDTFTPFHDCGCWHKVSHGTLPRSAVLLVMVVVLFSRHPNHFGEMLLWFGAWLSCSSAFTRRVHYLSVVGPCMNAFLLLFVSGVPLLEKSSDAKWGKDPSYQHYKKTTPVLIPNPWKH